MAVLLSVAALLSCLSGEVLSSALAASGGGTAVEMRYTLDDVAVGAAESDEQDGVSKYLYLPEAELADGKHPCVIIIQPRLKRLFIYILIEKNIYIKLNITSSDEEHWNDRLNWLDTSLNDWFKRLSFDRIYFNYGDYKRVVDRNMRIDYLRGKYDFSYDVVC